MTNAARVPRTPLLIEIGTGELLDRITILEIKIERLDNPAKRGNVSHELGLLRAVRVAHAIDTDAVLALERDLKAVNAQLWEIEDDIRACEARSDFGPTFVALARAVYVTNDRRAAIKKAVNVLTDATVVEEKSYGEVATALRP